MNKNWVEEEKKIIDTLNYRDTKELREAYLRIIELFRSRNHHDKAHPYNQLSIYCLRRMGALRGLGLENRTDEIVLID